MERQGGSPYPNQENSRLQPSSQEQGQPRQESTEGSPAVENVQRPKPPRTVFECAIPKVRPSPLDIRPMLRDGLVTEEQAQEAEQEWRENLRTWDKQRLEKAICSMEERRYSYANLNKLQPVQDAEQELNALREELRQRE